MEEFKRGAGPLLAALIGTMCGLITVTNYSQGFFVGPVTQEFGWDPGQFFLGFTLMMVAGLFTAPAVGGLVEKWGARPLAIVGLAGHALAYVLLSFNPGSLPLWYLSFVLLAVLGAGSLPIIWTKVVNGWFVENRGKAIGIVMVGTGIGAFLLPPIVEAIISNYGWRTGYRAVGIGAAVVSLPFVIALFHERKFDIEGGPVTEAGRPPVTWGVTAGEAMRSTKFWFLGAVLFLTAFVIVGLLSNFERILTAEGLARSDISILAAILGLTVIVGRLLIGALVDRFWAPGVAVVFFTLPIVGLLLLLNVQITFVSAAFIAIAVGLAAGAELDLLAFLTSRYFGTAHYGAIFGRVFAFFTVGAGIAPPIFGGAAAAMDGYGPVLMASIAILLVSQGLFMAMGKYPTPQETA